MKEEFLAVNKPIGDNARKGAVKKRTQRKIELMGKSAWTKRDKTSGEFMAVKKSAKNSRAFVKSAPGSKSRNISRDRILVFL